MGAGMTNNWTKIDSFGLTRWERQFGTRTYTVRLIQQNKRYEFVCTHPDGWVLASGPTAAAVMLQADTVLQHALEGTIV